MAEMTVLCAALYREYNTTIAPGFEDTSPAITARVETFYDERFPKVKVYLSSNTIIQFQLTYDRNLLVWSSLKS